MTWLSKLLSKVFKIREHSDGDIIKPFLEHMEDLRWTLLKMGLCLVAAMVVAFLYRNELMHILQAPLADVDPELPGNLIVTEIAGAFMISLKMSFLAGIVMAFPFLVYFLAEFVLPALTRQEKKYLFPAIAGGTVLFCIGVAVAYYYILPETILFFYNYTKALGVKEMWTWSSYASMFSWLTIGFGLLCELPVVVIVLALLGIINYKLLAATRSYAITGIFILAAIIAPTPDPATLLFLAVPIVLLYESCIWIVWLLNRRQKKNADVSDLLE